MYVVNTILEWRSIKGSYNTYVGSSRGRPPTRWAHEIKRVTTN